MGVQLTVIGSSPAWPNPGSAHSGYVVEASGRLLLDCGPGVLSRLRTSGLLAVDAIAITHFHLDHWGDLVPWVWFTKHGGLSHKPVLWLPPTGRRELDTFAGWWGHPGMFEETFEIADYEPHVPFEAAGFRLVAEPMRHYDIEAFGFRVEGPGDEVLAYSGDTGPCDSLPVLAAEADLFLCEATLTDAGEDATPRGHLSAAEALAVGNPRTMLTHRPAELPTPPGAERAIDGLVVQI